MEKKTRNIGIDVLKCLAAILITNSHMGLLYPHFKQLATGGAIGDVLFFFCSGFTLFLGRKRSFPNYYKRRISRIYPTVFAWAILASFLLGYDQDMRFTILYGGRWFVTCIMIYYIPLYFIQRYFMKYIWHIVFVVFVFAFLWLTYMDEQMPHNIYGTGNCRYIFFFCFMLLGAKMGVSESMQSKTIHNFLKCILCIVLFYGIIMYSMRLNNMWRVQIISLVPLYGIAYYLYLLCNSVTARKLYEHKVFGFLIRLIGGCCLEIYLVQFALFTDKMNHLFPINLLIMFTIIVIAAYLVRTTARLFSQIFKEEDFNWSAMLKV